MNTYDVTLHRFRPSHAIKNVFTTIPAKAAPHVAATEIMEIAKRKWPAWSVIGIEKSA